MRNGRQNEIDETAGQGPASAPGMARPDLPVRVLLGGVPFGNNNIGDEAILEGAIGLLRARCPSCAITVATAAPEDTAKLLSVDTCLPLGFSECTDRQLIEAEMQRHDCFIWCGATGLSDYPEVPLRLLEFAQQMGKKTILWGVGMNAELNPALYRLQAGRRRQALTLVQKLTFGKLNALDLQERRLERRAYRKIRQHLQRADLVVVRDKETKEILNGIGVTGDVIVGGDAALSLHPAHREQRILDDSTLEFLSSERGKIGVCVSAQRELADKDGFLKCLRRLVDRHDCDILFVPMDSVKDAEVMGELHKGIDRPGRTLLLKGANEPRAVIAALSRLDAVISSRLHLLILASIEGVSLVGIARGTKFDNFLRHFDIEPVGDVESCDFDLLEQTTVSMLAAKDDFAAQAEDIRKTLIERLEHAADRVAAVVTQ